MPVAQGGPPPLRQVVLIGLGVVMTLATILFIVTQSGQLLQDNDISLDLGDGIYRPGIPADELAEAIAEQGPFLLPDLAGGDSDIFLQHRGDDPGTGWVAIAARPASAPRDCLVVWDPDTAHFVDSCEDTTYPADGAGLPTHPVTVDPDGNIEVDLDTLVPPRP